MEDNLMRIFGDPERTKRLLSVAGMKSGEAIESRLLSRQIERAQRKVEAHNFDVRKQLLEYDDVSNDQRKVVYAQRTELMEADDVADAILGIREEVVAEIVGEYIPPESVEELWDADGLTKALEREFGLHMNIAHKIEEDDSLTEAKITDLVLDTVLEAYQAKTDAVGDRVMRELEKGIMLRQLDSHWKEHIGALDYLRQGIGLRSFAQKNPKQEYKREAFEMFGEMLEQVKHDTISILARVRIQSEQDVQRMEAQRRAVQKLQAQHAEASALGSANEPAPEPQSATATTPFIRDGRKVGRNEPCPCGSGRKYKQCHGKLG
jgi:preprotein translocase subunit SecA